MKVIHYICAFFDWIGPPYPTGNPFPIRNGRWVPKHKMVELIEKGEWEL